MKLNERASEKSGALIFDTINLKLFWQKLPLEALIWFIGLLGLAWSPLPSKDHFTLCPLALAGLDWCPGCGLGTSITLLFHGYFAESLHMHPLGGFAVVVLSFRIKHLTKTYYKLHGTNN
jgi:hypothetical protein